MNRAWLLCPVALALDGLALSILGADAPGGILLTGWLALHALACLLFALALARLLPYRHAGSGREAFLLAFCLALVLPLLGMAGMLGLLAAMFWLPELPAPAAGWLRPGVPELPPLQAWTDGWRARNIRAILRTAPDSQTRLAALRATLKLPDARAAALLRQALRDGDEEVRLLAHALLSRKEKAIESRLHALQLALDTPPTPDAPDAAGGFAVHKALAYGYWQLALLDPPGRATAAPVLCYAGEHARLALEQQAGDTGLLLLQGHILRGQHELAAATTAFERAADGGLPQQHTRPYLAEMAFQRRRAGNAPPSGPVAAVAGRAQRLSAVARSGKGGSHARAGA